MLNRYGLVDERLLDLVESTPTYRALKDVKTQDPDSTVFPSTPQSGATNVSPRHGDTSEMQEVGDKAISELKARHGKTGVQIGKRLGCGAYGCVHATDVPGRVVKIDTGRTEARLAQHVIANPEIFKNIKSLPRYHSVHKTNVTYGNRPVWAIHREDLSDLDSHHNKWNSMKHAMDNARFRAEQKLEEDKRSAKQRGHTLDHDKVFHGHLREQVSLSLQKLHDNHFKGTDHEHHFKQVHKDINHLVRHGLMPCDLHASNWGQRKNGEVVMRDVGCYHIHNPKQAN